MQERQEFNLLDATSKFCVSFISCNVSSYGLTKFVAAWNLHSIPGNLSHKYVPCNVHCTLMRFLYNIGRGVPNNLEVECKNITSIPSQELPPTDDAVRMYHSHGGALTQYGLFGCDPLRNRADLIQRGEVHFSSTHCSFEEMFSNVVSQDGALFREAILDFIRVTKSFQLLL